jgi:ketosteroid isomerase-like protein
MSALAAKHKSHILKNNEHKQRTKHMSNNHVQTVKDFFAAIGRGDLQRLLALCAEDIEWIIPGEGWPLAGTYPGTRDWRICFRRLPKRLKLSRSRANS